MNLAAAFSGCQVFYKFREGNRIARRRLVAISAFFAVFSRWNARDVLESTDEICIVIETG